MDDGFELTISVKELIEDFLKGEKSCTNNINAKSIHVLPVTYLGSEFRVYVYRKGTINEEEKDE